MQPLNDRDIEEFIRLLESLQTPLGVPGQYQNQVPPAPDEQETEGCWDLASLMGTVIGVIIGVAIVLWLFPVLFGG